MDLIKDTNYILIQGWMITKLKLEGKKLLLFALIYGFTQVEDTWFTGSTKYCAQWCDCSDKYILKLLKELVEAGYIEKETIYRDDGGIAGIRCRTAIRPEMQ